MKFLKHLLPLLSLPFLTACDLHQYIQNGNNVPLHSQKNESRVSLSLRSHAIFGGADLQLSHAVTDNFACMLNLDGVNAKIDGDESNAFYGELAPGLFKFAPATGASEDDSSLGGWCLEAYGGLGYGITKNEYYGGSFSSSKVIGSSELQYYKIFIQPAVGWRGRRTEIALAYRLAYLDFYRGTFFGDSGDALSDYQYLISKRRFWLREPVLVMRFGRPNVRFQMLLGTSTVPDEIGPKAYFSVGIIGTKFWK